MASLNTATTPNVGNLLKAQYILTGGLIPMEPAEAVMKAESDKLVKLRLFGGLCLAVFFHRAVLLLQRPLRLRSQTGADPLSLLPDPGRACAPGVVQPGAAISGLARIVLSLGGLLRRPLRHRPGSDHQLLPRGAPIRLGGIRVAADAPRPDRSAGR